MNSLEPRHAPGPPGPAREAALGAAKALARRALHSGVAALHDAVEAVGGDHDGALAGRLRRQIPIQRSVDVAVPLAVCWEEWMALTSLPEGVDRVQDIVREDDERLTGCLADGTEWEADVLDRRTRESFAWQSHGGSDVAGLVTFHALSDRLTRIELSLDIVPRSAAQALALSTRLADRRAAADLRRLKARLELISPDEYDDDRSADR